MRMLTYGYDSIIILLINVDILFAVLRRSADNETYDHVLLRPYNKDEPTWI
jgi:hypothetical protein